MAHELTTLTNTTVMNNKVLFKGSSPGVFKNHSMGYWDKEQAAWRTTIAVCSRPIPKPNEARKILTLVQFFSLLCDAY
jgi:hypothetical protein